MVTWEVGVRHDINELAVRHRDDRLARRLAPRISLNRCGLVDDSNRALVRAIERGCGGSPSGFVLLLPGAHNWR